VAIANLAGLGVKRIWIGRGTTFYRTNLLGFDTEFKMVPLDRAALDWAIEHGISYGGWCPRGRKSEDGPIDFRYRMEETPSGNYAQRTEWNVSDSHGTVVFSIAALLTGGSQMTVELAHKHQKPLLHLSREGDQPMPEQELLRFIREHRIKILNVAGPRASKEPEVAGFVKEVLDKVWPIP
jgi:hypothetical protein